MTIELINTTEAVNNNGESVLLWKFKDEAGNIWNTETSFEGTEEEAASIILFSMNNNG